jgi:phosphate:Na+ symporter
VAILLLPLMLKFLETIPVLLGQDTGPVTLLAMFHTLFNTLGVLVLWPLTKPMIRKLKGSFRSAEEDEAKPVYLDKNVISTPVLAMHALEKELARLGIIASRMAKGALSSEISISPQLVKDKAIFSQLEISVGDFVNLMQRSHLPADLDDALPSGLRVAGYYASMTELATMIAKKQSEIQPVQEEKIAGALNHFKGTVVKMFKASNVELEGFNLEASEESLQKVIDEYHDLKNILLRSSTQDILHVRQMIALQDLISYMRRLAELTAKAARYLAGLTQFAELKTEDESESKTS